MTENGNPAFRDLTLNEAWRLIKRFFSTVLVCALVFVFPYLLLTSASKYADAIVGDKTASKWSAYLLSFVVLLFVVFHMNDLFSRLSGLFANLANLTIEMSWVTRTACAILLISFFLGWIHFTTITFFVSVLIIIPAGFTYDEYTKLLRDKKSGWENS